MSHPIAIGYWVDHDQPDLPNPTDFIDPDWDEEERLVVGRYLLGGQPMATGSGCSLCRVCGEPNGFGEFTDGVYLWPEGLAHYVLDHSVRLPDDFIQHIVTNGLAKNVSPDKLS